MSKIQILDSETIDKIAAGEVVERPASVVKELVENAIDAGATAVTVEVKDGGIELIRVTDNGAGMEKEQLRTAFQRHATSKIRNADDLLHVASLGFRGEALSSISAVAKVEVITKTKERLTGSRLVLEGGKEVSFDEVGAPDGTTFLVRNLFFNTPVRRKFLKTPAAEGGAIADLMEHLALSRPDISFKFVLGNQTRFHTSGNGDLKEVIYRIYGRQTAASLVPMQWERDGVRIEGYLGKPVMVRSSRSFEIYYINGRFIKSRVIAKALEDGYKEYLMQHKFPFCVLHMKMDCAKVDVNVHPTKMDVRFSNAMEFCDMVCEAVKTTLKSREMIPEAVLGREADLRREEKEQERALLSERRKLSAPEPFEQKRAGAYRVMEESVYRSAVKTEESAVSPEGRSRDFRQNPVWARVLEESGKLSESGEEKAGPLHQEGREPAGEEEKQEEEVFFFEEPEMPEAQAYSKAEELQSAVPSEIETPSAEMPPAQLNLFTEKILQEDNKAKYRLIGQVFDTYWLIQFEDRLLIVDQHAAHEKVKYERLMKQYQEKSIASQVLMPPVIVSLTGQEETILSEYRETFLEMGFEVEAFGGNEYALRSVPVDLYGCGEREMFLEVLDELGSYGTKGTVRSVEEKIASMSCKAAVKGNSRISAAEAEELIDELLTLENPYNCPHGRPTVITMSKTEMERKFKRIL